MTTATDLNFTKEELMDAAKELWKEPTQSHGGDHNMFIFRSDESYLYRIVSVFVDYRIRCISFSGHKQKYRCIRYSPERFYKALRWMNRL